MLHARSVHQLKKINPCRGRVRAFGACVALTWTPGFGFIGTKKALVARSTRVLHRTCAMQSYQASLGESNELDEELQKCFLRGRYIIPPEEVEEVLHETGMPIDELLYSLIKPASRLAKSPISKFRVGAVGMGGSGAIYVGANMEFPRAPLNNSVHAEQFLLVNLLHHGEHELVALAVSEAPCGHCRQFYSEIYKAEAIRFMFGKDSHARYLDEILPDKFGPSDLIHGDPFPLLLQKQNNSVKLTSCSKAVIKEREEHEGGSLFALAAEEALLEAQGCYSPYSRCPSGVALIEHSGRVHSGGYVESAAYNPSLSPFHAAVIAAFVGGMSDFSEIKEVVLVEKNGPTHLGTVHENNLRLLLNSVAPDAQLTTLRLSCEHGSE